MKYSSFSKKRKVNVSFIMYDFSFPPFISRYFPLQCVPLQNKRLCYPEIMRVLISVYDKAGIVEFAKALQTEFKADLISTGGTLKALSDAGLKVTPVDEVTNFPEMMDGRVKTMHPAIHAGLLAVRSKADHMSQLQEQGIEPIDMVVVNLYPFQETVNSGASREEIIEQIDIGGPSMLRSAAKNHESVTVIPSPEHYPLVIKEMRANKGKTSSKTRQYLATEVFWKTSLYDAAIVEYFSGHKKALVGLKNGVQLRYGENPHQKGMLYAKPGSKESTLATAKVLQGKDMSFLNYFDADAALNMVRSFPDPAVSMVKHANPCGMATNPSLLQAFKSAHDCDPRSAFGVIIAMNRPCTVEIINEMFKREMFVEVIIAPSFESNAVKLLKKKKNIRPVEVGELKPRSKEEFDIKSINGGFLVQDLDTKIVEGSEIKIVTESKPNSEQIEDLLFAFQAVKHIKSNAVVLVKNQSTVGIGAGQMSRVDSTEIAVRKAGDRAKGSVLASDAFFPFSDSVEEAHQYGISAIIQPGGSMRDQEVINKANELNIPMVFTGVRAFKH
jgi:phosphoribosylaminoimidazolecarboxamide formyltransferase / IMP cyclohydrolase